MPYMRTRKKMRIHVRMSFMLMPDDLEHGTPSIRVRDMQDIKSDRKSCGVQRLTVNDRRPHNDLTRRVDESRMRRCHTIDIKFGAERIGINS